MSPCDRVGARVATRGAQIGLLLHKIKSMNVCKIGLMLQHLIGSNDEIVIITACFLSRM